MGIYEGFGVLKNHLGFYEGEFVGGIKEGKGVFKTIAGAVYTGQWKRNVYHGTGVIVNSSGSYISRYEGEWQHGRKMGKGTITFSNSDTYEGFFRDDTMHGVGIYTFCSGSTIEGKWSHGRLDGKVVFTRVKDKTRKTYAGVVKDNSLRITDIPEFPL